MSAQALDEFLFRAINRGIGHPWFDYLMWLISNPLFLGVLIFIFVIFETYKNGINFLKWALAGGILFGLSDWVAFRFLKPYFERIRPCKALEGVYYYGEACSGTFTMPSNHAMNAATFMVFFSLVSKRYRFVLVVPLLIGYSRVYMGKHYPGDVLIGLFLGSILGVVGYGATKRILKITSNTE